MTTFKLLKNLFNSPLIYLYCQLELTKLLSLLTKTRTFQLSRNFLLKSCVIRISRFTYLQLDSGLLWSFFIQINKSKRILQTWLQGTAISVFNAMQKSTNTAEQLVWHLE